MSSTITNLPIEVIDLIFGHLTMANDRCRTAQVCKLFNKVIRSQSIRKGNNTLKLDDPPSMDSQKVSGESLFRVFEHCESLPFSKLIISDQTWTRNIVMQSAFWSSHGYNISEILINIGYHFSNMENTLLSILSKYFPNLKKLSIGRRFYIDKALKNTMNYSLPIEELYLSSRLPPETILTFLRCSPHLKKVVIKKVKPVLLPKILPWIESVEDSCLHFVKMPLAKLINLPSKVVIGKLTIRADEKPKMIREFFKRPRVIETLILERQDDNLEFNQDEEEGENNPRYIFFNRDQVEALRGAKSINYVELPGGVLDFGGSLDLLAQLPGVYSISLKLFWHQPDQLYPLYWSSPNTAKKIHEIKHRADQALNYLGGLSNLTTFSVPFPDENEEEVLDVFDPYEYGISGDDIQQLIHNCPNLKNLGLMTIFANDADLIGTGDRLPFSSLGKLKYLSIFNAPNITSEAFKSAFKFPNLKYFQLQYLSGEPFNQNDAKFFSQNCPNVSELNFRGFHMNEEAFEYLIRNLPYLRKILIDTEDPNTRMISKEKVMALKNEFPYIDSFFVEGMA